MSNQRFSITPAKAATDNSLTDSVHRTLTVIGIFGNREGWCWPGQGTLAEMRGVSRQTISTHIKALTDLGYLNIYPRYDEETGAQKSNMMQIKFDFNPDLTGGVKSKALQGGTSPEVDTPPQVQGFTHNAPFNAPFNDKSYISPPAYDLNADFMTALATIAKETLAPGFNEKKFENAAFALIGWDAELSDVAGFAEYWRKFGWHNQKPALTNIVNHWNDYKDGRDLRSKEQQQQPIKVADDGGMYV